MPVIPQYQQQEKRLSSLNAPRYDVEVPDESFGKAQAEHVGKLGVSLQSVGETLNNHVLEMKADRDNASANDLLNQAKSDSKSMFDEGLLNLKDKDALDLCDQFGQKFSEFRKKYEDQANNKVQQEILQKGLDALGKNLLVTAASIQGREMRAYCNRIKLDSIATAGEEAAANYRDHTRLEASRAEVIRLTDELTAGRAGKASTEAIREPARIKALTEYHGTVISKMLADSACTEALQYFERYKDDIAPSAQKATRELLQKEVELGQAQTIAHSAVEACGTNKKAMLEWVSANAQGHVADKAIKLIDCRMRDIELAKEETEKQSNQFASEQVKGAQNLAEASSLALKHGKTPKQVQALIALASTVHQGSSSQDKAKNTQLSAIGRKRIDAMIAAGKKPTELEIAESVEGKLQGSSLKDLFAYAQSQGAKKQISQSRVENIYTQFAVEEEHDSNYYGQLDTIYQYVQEQAPDGRQMDDATLRSLVSSAVYEYEIASAKHYEKKQAEGSGGWGKFTGKEGLPKYFFGHDQKKIGAVFRTLYGANGGEKEFHQFHKELSKGLLTKKQLSELSSDVAAVAAEDLRKHNKAVTYKNIITYIMMKKRVEE